MRNTFRPERLLQSAQCVQRHLQVAQVRLKGASSTDSPPKMSRGAAERGCLVYVDESSATPTLSLLPLLMLCASR